MSGLYEWSEWAADSDGWDPDPGAPGLYHFSGAVQTWSVMQNRPTSVADAAAAFNVAPTRIIEAAENNHWMLLVGPRDDFTRLMIEHDGE